MPMKTIGQAALLFGTSRADCMEQLDGLPEETLYEGEVAEIPRVVARRVAPLHPRWHRYYQDNMAVLYQGRGPYAGGTEDSVRAVQSYAPQQAAKAHTYVVIWLPLYAGD